MPTEVEEQKTNEPATQYTDAKAEPAQPPAETGITWHNLASVERKRTYHYADGKSFSIENVSVVGISKSGGHRIVTADGRKFIPSRTWLAIEVDCDDWSF